MFKQLKTTWAAFFLISSALASGCVSVSLQSEKTVKAEDLKFTEPSLPFRSLKAENADLAWQSEKTGNTIAFLSECKSATDSDLRTIESESLTALEQIKILTSRASEYNGRESLETTAEGHVDGIPVRLQITVFKKNSCNYTLSFVGRKSVFEKEQAEFIKFKESFVAP